MTTQNEPTRPWQNPFKGLRPPTDFSVKQPSAEELARRAAVRLEEHLQRRRDTQLHTIELLESHDEQFQVRFRPWLLENWSIWEAFCSEAEEVWANGVRHYGARTIFEYLRHQSMKRQVNGAFKLNNSYVPDCARLYALVFPTRSDFFEVREMSAAAARGRIRNVKRSNEVLGELGESAPVVKPPRKRGAGMSDALPAERTGRKRSPQGAGRGPRAPDAENTSPN